MMVATPTPDMWPSVTEILASVGLGPDYSAVPPDVLERAAQRGKALHAAIQWDAAGELNEESLHAEIAPAFSAYRKFLAETGYRVIEAELEVNHPTWRYRGHPDSVGFLGKTRAILDWKMMETLDLPPAGSAAIAHPVERQLAAYRLAWEVGRPQESIGVCAVVQLKRDGTYRFTEIPKPRLSLAEQEFLAALVVLRARQRR